MNLSIFCEPVVSWMLTYHSAYSFKDVIYKLV